MSDRRTNWTLVYRNPQVNHFERVTNWSGTWPQAHLLVLAFAELHPGLQVLDAPTTTYERQRTREIMSRVTSGEYTQREADAFLADNRTVLVDGQRVPVRETGTLSPEELRLVLSVAGAQAELDDMVASLVS
jgi:hypothetical protein